MRVGPLLVLVSIPAAFGAARLDAQAASMTVSAPTTQSGAIRIIATDSKGGKPVGVSVASDMLEMRGDTIVLTGPARLESGPLPFDIAFTAADKSSAVRLEFTQQTSAGPKTLVLTGQRIQLSQAVGDREPQIAVDFPIRRP
jgi:hypothetical protein